MSDDTAKTVLGRISQGHLECPICYFRFTDPKILDCQHSFCLKCLEELLLSRQQPKADTITCPVCRRVTAVPDSGASGLANSFVLSSLVDEFNKQERLLTQRSASLLAPTCERCVEGTDAVARCQDCQENICQNCQEAHERSKHTSKHCIVAVESRSTKQPSPKEAQKTGTETNTPKCTEHTTYELCFYCHTCEASICARCAAINHRTAEHNYTEINDAITSFRKNVDDTLQKFQKCREQFRVVDNSIEHARSRLRTMVARACRDISAKEEEEITKIKTKSRLLKEKVLEIGQERDGRYEKELTSNRDQMKRAEEIIVAVIDLMQQADGVELLDLKPEILYNLKFLEMLRLGSVRHDLSFIGVKCQDIVCDRELGYTLRKEKWLLKKEYGKKGKGYGKFMCATGVGCLSDGSIAVTDQTSQRLTMVTPTGLYKNARVRFEALYGVAVTSNDLLLVTDGKTLRMFNPDLQQLASPLPPLLCDSGAKNSVLTGIDVDKKNHRVAVADIWNKKITIYTLEDGSVVTTVPSDTVVRDLAFSNKERLIVTNYENCNLLCVDMLGNELFKIDTSVDGKSVRPAGICCDDAGDIYVATHHDETGSCEVHHYSAEGTFIGCVTRELYNPLNMTFTPAGDLLLADMYSVKIFHRV